MIVGRTVFDLFSGDFLSPLGLLLKISTDSEMCF